VAKFLTEIMIVTLGSNFQFNSNNMYEIGCILLCQEYWQQKWQAKYRSTHHVM